VYIFSFELIAKLRSIHRNLNECDSTNRYV